MSDRPHWWQELQDVIGEAVGEICLAINDKKMKDLIISDDHHLLEDILNP